VLNHELSMLIHKLMENSDGKTLKRDKNKVNRG